MYFIIHLDVYQGKNAENIGIPEEIWAMPTTQKAVVNAIIQAKLEDGIEYARGIVSVVVIERIFLPNGAHCAHVPLIKLLRRTHVGTSTKLRNERNISSYCIVVEV